MRSAAAVTNSPIRRLIDASSLGAPEARALRAATSDETARRIVERSKQIDTEHVLYFCPTTRSVECCPKCSGWDTCCTRPDLHRPLPREGQLRRYYRWRQVTHRAFCRVGLHFPTWNHQCDAYTCPCRRVLLGAEHIRWD